eukprot:1630510-Amphidinium_carterae.3
MELSCQFLDELELPDPGDTMMPPAKRQKPVVAEEPQPQDLANPLPAEDNQDVHEAAPQAPLEIPAEPAVGITEAQMTFVTQACLAQTGNVYKTLPVTFFKNKLIDLGIETFAWAADQGPNPETCRSHWRRQVKKAEKEGSQAAS